MKTILSDTQKQEIAKAYLAGAFGYKIKKQYKIGYNAFWKVLSDQGVAMRPSRQRALSSEQEKEIGQLYTEGLSEKTIGKRYGVSYDTIARALSRQGVEVRLPSGARAFSDEQEQEIAQLYLDGVSSASLSEKYEVSVPTIISAIVRQGGIIPVSFTKKIAMGIVPGEEIGKLYLGGLSTERIGEKYGVSHHTIIKALSRQGIETRSRHDAGMKHSLNENAFDVLTPGSAYWAGFLLSDGNVHFPKAGGQPVVAIGLNVKDKKHVEKFRSFLESSHKIYYGNHNNVSLAVSSQKLADSLSEYNIVPRKSFIATAPDALIDNYNFWRGEIDGDGSVAINKNGVPLVKLYGAKPIVNQFSKFIKSYEPECRATVLPSGSIWQATAYGRYAVHILYLLYHDASVSLNRKAATARKIDERFGNKLTRSIKTRSEQCT